MIILSIIDVYQLAYRKRLFGKTKMICLSLCLYYKYTKIKNHHNKNY